jgi:hypothetical protein
MTGEALKPTLGRRPSRRLLPQRFSADWMERYGRMIVIVQGRVL